MGRKRTLFRNAIIEKNTVKNINIYRSLATIVQSYKHGTKSSNKMDTLPKK